MNKVIQKQLEKLKKTRNFHFDDSTTHLIFEKTRSDVSDQDSTFVVNGVYKIVVANYIVNPPPDFTLDRDWNKGRKILDTTLLVQINQIAGKMIRFTGRGYKFDTDKTNDNFYENMWIPAKSIINYERVE